MTLEEYFNGVRSGNIAVLARAITLVESRNPRHQLLAEELLTRLLPFSGNSIRVGVSGVPGAGKSTFIDALGVRLIRAGRRVAVLAVDPSSTVTGGSILGDKTRMASLAAEHNAYIRPSPSAGSLGGVARKTRESMLLCEAAGFDVVLIETVGVGQSETMVAQMSDCFLAMMLSGAGDELQGMKRGILELADVVVVNKADGENRAAAALAARQYHTALNLLFGAGPGHDRVDAPVVLTASALHHERIDAVWNAIERRIVSCGEKVLARRKRQDLQWVWSIVEERVRQEIHAHPAVSAIKNELECQVLAGALPTEVAARRILEAFLSGARN